MDFYLVFFQNLSLNVITEVVLVSGFYFEIYIGVIWKRRLQ